MALVNDILPALQNAALADPRVTGAVTVPGVQSLAALTFEFGPWTEFHQAAPPRVVWVPTDGTIEGAEKGGGPLDTTQDPLGFNPVQILTRRKTVQAHCWGQDHDTAECLADVIWCALQSIAPGSYTPRGETHGAPENQTLGWLITLTFELLVPIARTADATVTATPGAETDQLLPPT